MIAVCIGLDLVICLVNISCDLVYHMTCEYSRNVWSRGKGKFVKTLCFSLPRQWLSERMKVINVRLEVFSLCNGSMLLRPNQIKPLAGLCGPNASSSDRPGYHLIILPVNKIDHRVSCNYLLEKATSGNIRLNATQLASSFTLCYRILVNFFQVRCRL